MYHISNDKRSKESSTWIYEALEHLLDSRSFDDITVTDVCNQAKIGRVTFYRHYDCLEDVLRKKCDERFEGFIPYFKEYHIHKRNYPGFLRPFLRYWYVNATILELIIKANKAYIINEGMDRLIELSKLLPLKENNIHLNYDNYYATIRTSVTLAILVEWIKNGLNLAPDDLSDLLLKQMKHALELNMLF